MAIILQLPAHTYTVTFHTSSTWHWDTLFFNCRHTPTQSHFTHHLPDTETHCSSTAGTHLHSHISHIIYLTLRHTVLQLPAHTYTVTFHTSSTWHWDTLFFNCRHTPTQSHFTHHLPDTETHCSSTAGTHLHSHISHIIYLTLRHTVLQLPAHTYTVTFHTSSTWHWDTLFSAAWHTLSIN